MREIIGQAVLLILILIGLSELIRLLFYYLVSPGKEAKMLIILPFFGEQSDVEQLLFHAQQLRWQRGHGVRAVLCVDYGMEEEARHICELYCREHSGFQLVEPGELDAFLLQNWKKNYEEG